MRLIRKILTGNINHCKQLYRYYESHNYQYLKKWRPSWKMVAILDFQVANGFIIKSCLLLIHGQSFMLVSQFERLYLLSA